MRPIRRRPERPMNCMQVGRRLQRYLDGELDALTARRILHHLEACRRCGMEAATYTAIKTSLAQAGEELSTDTLRRLRDFGERLVREGPHPPGSERSEGSAGA